MIELIDKPDLKARHIFWRNNETGCIIRYKTRSAFYFKYTENNAIDFEFCLTGNIVIILYNDFSKDFSESELEVFYDYNIKSQDILDSIDKAVYIKIIKEYSEKSNNIRKIYKFDDGILYGSEYIKSKYLEYLIKMGGNSFEIRCMPYRWGDHDFYIDNPEKNLEKKLYINDLFILKLYARGIKKSNNRGE